jgi:hypothetical protein
MHPAECRQLYEACKLSSSSRNVAGSAQPAGSSPKRPYRGVEIAGYGRPNQRNWREIILTAEQLAQIIVQSIDRHGLRGLIYEADGMADVVMHGKVNMIAVAHDVLEAVQAGDDVS